MRLVIKHHRSAEHSLQWREVGLIGRRAELVFLPNFYVRVGSFPQAWELSIDADGWRIFPPARLGHHATTWGALWPWRR